MIILRSAIFQVLFYSNCTLWFIAACIAWPLPSRFMIKFAHGWARSSLWLHEVIVGARVELRGLEHVPRGAAILASKHYSAWETMALVYRVEKPTYILKRELLRVPLFGWHLIKGGQIPIDRGSRALALAKMTELAKVAIGKGRQLIIFPEGTRRKVGAAPDYKFGVARLYGALNVPCVPVAMTSGLAWPRNTLLHYPRPILVEFLPPIPPGLEPEVFFERLQDVIETNTNRLLAEAGYRGPATGEASASPSQASA
jgi:1-acyl-sn-glycerol-3-phosphate acyltransferase